MEQIKNDLNTLGLVFTNLKSLSVKEARIAFRQKALELHPDKHPDNVKEEFTARFQEAGNSYQRILKYLIQNLNETKSDSVLINDEEVFARDNFDQCNFPF